ncbi:hypothetical protein BGX38DRAFT_586744 [Terfezia claveryi]|nr:hypothetical protein BGX38DRAFT_586744 [Terfezia claveryi]
MKFSITATIAALALAQLDWKTKLGWDGKITPIEEIGEIVSGPEIPKLLAKRTLGGVFMCPGYDWTTQPGLGCSYFVFGWNACVRLSDQTYRYTLSSVGPDSGTWCVIYQSTDCSWGGSNGFTNPGLARLEGSYWGQWNDNTGSIKCWW